jgi:hypothetical protein
MPGTTVTYPTENLIAGPIQTQQSKLAADTYYRGMILEYDADNDRYKAWTGAAGVIGIWLEEERDLEDNDYGSIIVGGEVFERGLTDSSGNAYTITEDIIAAFQAVGFYIKR